MVRASTLALFLIFKKKKKKAFNFSPLSITLAVGLSHMAFIVSRYTPYGPYLLRLSIIDVEFYELFFPLLMWYVTFINLGLSHIPCILKINVLSWWTIVLTCYLVQFANNFFTIFESTSSGILAYNFLFLEFLSDFVIKLMLAS